MTHRLSPVCVLLAVLLLGPLSDARAQFGIAAGLNFDSIQDITVDTQNLRGTYDNASGYHAGVFVDLGGRSFAVRIGAFYKDFGDLEISFGEGAEVPEVRNVDLSMIEFPIDLRLDLVPLSAVSPYLVAGPVFGLPRSDDEDFDASLNPLTMSGVVGGGLRLSLGSIALMPEFRYAIGLSGLTGDEFTIAGETFQVDEDQKSNTVQLRLGLRF